MTSKENQQAPRQDAEPEMVFGVEPMTRVQRAAQGTRDNAEGIGYGVAVLLPWITRDVFGIEVPLEVLSVGAAALTSIAVRLKERF